MSTTIIIVRHGETDWNREKVFRGRRDVPLNANGRAQAGFAAEALKSRRIAAAYASPLGRARETAEIILAPHDLKAAVCQELIDLDYGEWTGKTDAEVATAWPEEHALWAVSPQRVRPPGGETLQEVMDRAFGAMEALARKHDGQTIALFAHRAVNKLLVLGALTLGPDRFPFILQENACIDEVERTTEGYRILCLNDASHVRNAGADLLKADF